MIVGIHHLGVVVRDLERAIRFYRGAFGLSEALRFPLIDDPETRAMLGLTAIGGNAALLAGPNMMLELFQFEHSGERPVSLRQVNEAGFTHPCVQGAGMEALSDAFVTAGGELTSAPTDLGADITYAYPRDLDGNVIELEALPGALASPGNWFAHVSISTPDLDRALGFYAQFVGNSPRRSSRLGRNPKIDRLTGLADVEVSGAWLPAGNVELEFWQYHHPETRPAPRAIAANDFGYTHVAFEVDDVGAERGRAEKLGAVFQGDPVDRPAFTATYGRDPDGNIFELIAWKERARRLRISSLTDPTVYQRAATARAGHLAA